MKNILAIIPARAGSKGLKDKNIKLLNGIPLCAYSIRAAVESGVFSEIHFSTDSEKYADIAVEYGAAVPFLRDEILATDTANSFDVIKSVLLKYKEMGRNFDAWMLLQPTSPLRSAQDIVNAVNLMKSRKCQAVVSVTETDHHPYWCAELPEDGNLRIFHERIEAVKKEHSTLVGRQKMRPHYRINGAVYLSTVSHLFEKSDIFESDCLAYVMPKERSLDIDDQLDFDEVEFMLSKKSNCC